MLQPKRTKYRKMHKGRNDGLSWSANAVSPAAAKARIRFLSEASRKGSISIKRRAASMTA